MGSERRKPAADFLNSRAGARELGVVEAPMVKRPVPEAERQRIRAFLRQRRMREAENCGTGAGGFQPGNTCAKGGGAPSDAVERLKKSNVLASQLEYDAWKADRWSRYLTIFEKAGIPMTRDQLPKVYAKAEKEFAAWVQTAHIFSRVEPGILEKILTDGRMKNQHEVLDSRGLLDPDERQRIEHYGLNIPMGAAPIEYPIYGYLSPEDDGTDGVVGQFGKVAIRLKDSSVRERSTITVGDSIGLFHVYYDPVIPSKVTAPSYVSMQAEVGANLYDHSFDPARDIEGAHMPFVEAQIHGGVTLDDIEEVIFTKDTAPNEHLQSLLTERKIKWRVAETRSDYWKNPPS